MREMRCFMSLRNYAEIKYFLLFGYINDIMNWIFMRFHAVVRMIKAAWNNRNYGRLPSINKINLKLNSRIG